jgi:hypothetical protein
MADGIRSMASWKCVRTAPFARSGFLPGDVPLGHHGGSSALEWALSKAARGEVSRLSVIQARDWGVADRTIRELALKE